MRVKVKFREINYTFKPRFQNLQIIDKTRNPVIQPLNVTENGTYTSPEGVDGFNPVNVDIFQVQGEEYNGSYEVTPKVEAQILQTAEKVMRDDVTIKEIPYAEVTNPAGGTTIIIA